MSPFVPLSWKYSALSSSSSSSYYTPSINLKEIVVQPSDANPRTISRYSFIIRVIIFVLLESGFTALVSAALHKPIILHVPFANTEVKGAVTAIAIIWHTLAVYIVKDILLNIFSAEWMEQYDGSQRFSLQELDIVSRLTTGLMDQVRHCMSKRATLPFCLSFLSFLLLMLLNGLGPSAISVDFVPYEYPSTIQVANLNLSTGPALWDRANAIVRLELVQNVETSGFSATQPNILIPWPSPDSMSENVSMRYESDIIRYNFNCSWTMPSLEVLIDGTYITVDNRWQFKTTSPLDGMPVLHDGAVHGPVYDNTATDAQTVFLFVGGNGTQSTQHLNDIPSLTLHCNTTPLSEVNMEFVGCYPLLVSALVCDPQLEILPATISATMSSLRATISSGAPTVKNVPIGVANDLFAASLSYAGTETLPDGTIANVHSTSASARLFLPTSAWDFQRPSYSFQPLPLDKIHQNMTRAFASAAKAYLSGYIPDEFNPTALHSFGMVNTSAVIEVQKLALVGTKPFFAAYSATVGLLVVLLSAIVVITQPDQLESFDLENIVKKLG